MARRVRQRTLARRRVAAAHPAATAVAPPSWCTVGAERIYRPNGQRCTVTKVEAPVPGDRTTFVSVQFAAGGDPRGTTVEKLGPLPRSQPSPVPVSDHQCACCEFIGSSGNDLHHHIHTTHAGSPAGRSPQPDTSRHRHVDATKSLHLQALLAGTEPSVHAKSRLIVVAADILGTTGVSALLDTGCDKTMVDTTKTGITPKPHWKRIFVTITTANGALEEKPAWEVPSMTITVRGVRITTKNALALKMPQLPYGMLIGQDALARANAKILCATGEVVFPSGGRWSAPGPARQGSTPLDTSGITAAKARRLARARKGHVIRITDVDTELLREAAALATGPTAAYLHAEVRGRVSGQPTHVPSTTATAAAATTAATTDQPPWTNPDEYVPSLPDDPSPAERQRLIDALLLKHRASTTQKDNLPHTTEHPRIGALADLELKIPTADQAFRKCRTFPPKRLSLEESKELRRQLLMLLSRGFIRPSTSPYGAACFFVPKQGGQVRLVIDYRGLNSQTTPSRTPAPNGQSQVDFLSGAKWISSIDLCAAYHHIPIAEEDRHKTAFVSELGQFEWTVCAFGLIGSPGIWNRLMLRLFGPLTRFANFAQAFVDDLSVRSLPGESLEDHLARVDDVLKELAANGLFANLSKCVIAATSVRHLGQVVGRHGVRIDASRVKVIKGREAPTSHAELRTFLGLTTYLSRHIPGYAEIARPLNAIRNARPGTGGAASKFAALWTDEHQAAFEQLKAAVCAAPVLIAPNFAEPFFVQADASKTALGAALLQRRGELLLPIAYTSRALTSAETRWSIYDTEFQALIEATKKFRCYLLHSAKQWIAITDHNPLVHWHTPGSSLTLRQIRQLDHLASFDFRFEYLPGAKMIFADLLSRPPGASIRYDLVQPSFDDADCDICKGACGHNAGRRIAAALLPSSSSTTATTTTTAAAASTTVTGLEEINSAAIVANYSKDPYTAKIKAAFDTGSNQSHFRRRYQRLASGIITVRTGVDAGSPRTLIPNVTDVTDPIFALMHDNPASGHTGIDTTYRRVRARFFAHGLLNSVEKYVGRCKVCRENRVRAHRPYGMAEPIELPSLPGSDLTTDFTFKLPRSKCPVTKIVYDGIQIYVDRLTKVTRFLPCVETITAEGAADLFTREILPHWGLPRSIISDRDPRFTSVFWKQLAKVLRVKLRMSTANHPQSDGQSEEAFRWMKQLIRAFCEDTQADWVAMLPILELCTNTTATNSRNGHSPFQVFQGFNPLVPAGLSLPPTMGLISAAVADRAKFRERAVLAARDAIQAAQDISAARINAGRIDAPLKAGDWARVKKTHLVPPADRGDATKFTFRRPWPGPFQVVRQVGRNAFEIDLPAATYPHAHRVINVSALEPERITVEDEFAAGASHTAPDTAGQVTHVVDHVVQHRVRRNQHEYLVRWKGGARAHDTWEQIASFHDAGTTTQALLDFELARVGDNRHVDASVVLAPLPTGQPGTTVKLADGWTVYHCHDNDSATSIARTLGHPVGDLIDFNIAWIPGLTKKSKLQRGTAVRLISPATAASA